MLNAGLVVKLAGFNLSIPSAGKLCIAVVGLAFLPLVMLAMFSAHSPAVTLFGDAATLSRLLLILPLLVMSAPQYELLIAETLRHPQKAGLVDSTDAARYDRWLQRLMSLAHSPVAAFLLLSLALVTSVIRPALPGPFDGRSHWSLDEAGNLSLAGKWFVWVAAPYLRFVVLMWLWRTLLWTTYLARLSSFRLNLEPAHPDGSAGIGYLGFVQQRHSVLLLVGSIAMVGSSFNRVTYLGQSIESLALPIIIYVTTYTLALIAPLLFTFHLLLRTKRAAIFNYSRLGLQMTRQFEQDWIKANNIDDRLASPNPSAIADYGTMHATVRDMTLIPVRKSDLLWMLFSVCAPFLLLIVATFPLEVIVRSILTEIPPIDIISDIASSAR